MPILFGLIAAALSLLLGLRLWRNIYGAPKTRAQLWWRVAMLVVVLAIVAGVLSGRIHPLGILGAAVPLLWRLASLALQFLPFVIRHIIGDRGGAQTGRDRAAAEAAALLGLNLQDGLSERAVLEAHRKLMQKLHPDRGGNDHLAAKLNEARDLLLQHLRQRKP